MKSISLYNRYEKHHTWLLMIYYIAIFFIVSILLSLFILHKGILEFVLVITTIMSIFMFIIEMLLSTNIVVFGDKDSIEIHGKIGTHEKVDISEVVDIHTSVSKDIISTIKKGTYYSLYFKLKNGKRVMISENLHVTTLVYFLKEFLNYYGDRLPQKCVKHIEEIIKEKEPIAKKI